MKIKVTNTFTGTEDILEIADEKQKKYVRELVSGSAACLKLRGACLDNICPLDHSNFNVCNVYHSGMHGKIEILEDEMGDKKDEPFIFKVGDKVKIEGVLRCNESGSCDDYRLRLDIPNGSVLTFTDKGYYNLADTKPTLQLVERPKKKVKKYKYGYIQLLDNGRYQTLVESKEYYLDDEDFSNRTGWTKFQRLDFTEIEVEEEE